MASSYYNAYAQKHSAANLAYGAGQPWNWTTNYPSNHQFLGDMEAPPPPSHHHHHQMYYNPHHMFHSAVPHNVAAEWPSNSSAAVNDGYAQAMQPMAHQMLQQHHVHNVGAGGSAGGAGVGTVGAGVGVGGGSPGCSGGPGGNVGPSGSNLISGGPNSSGSNGRASVNNAHVHENSINNVVQQRRLGPMISPPITLSGSPSPRARAASTPHSNVALNNSGNNSSLNTSSGTSNNSAVAHNCSNSSPPLKNGQYYEWMKKPIYPAQPQPDNENQSNDNIPNELTNTTNLEDELQMFLDLSGKTRTKDKYRVVYSDFQRLELEKEYCTSRYITIRRKTELAQALLLSERQVKIWFQNRRAKERKLSKKGAENPGHIDYMIDSKSKLENSLHLQHSLHTMNPMAAMGMQMRLTPHIAHSHSFAAAAAHSHQMQQHNVQISVAAAAGVGALSM